MPRLKTTRRRRPERRAYEMLPIEKALEILELLAARPDGLTVLEIVAHFRLPAPQVIRTIVVMQQRRWLRTLNSDRLMIGHRILEVAVGRQLS